MGDFWIISSVECLFDVNELAKATLNILIKFNKLKVVIVNSLTSNRHSTCHFDFNEFDNRTLEFKVALRIL